MGPISEHAFPRICVVAAVIARSPSTWVVRVLLLCRSCGYVSPYTAVGNESLCTYATAAVKDLTGVGFIFVLRRGYIFSAAHST